MPPRRRVVSGGTFRSLSLELAWPVADLDARRSTSGVSCQTLLLSSRRSWNRSGVVAEGRCTEALERHLADAVVVQHAIVEEEKIVCSAK